MSDILNVVLLTTGRYIELVELEIITQCEKVGIELLSCVSLESYINKKENILDIDNFNNDNNNNKKKSHSHPCILHTKFSNNGLHSSSIYTFKDYLISALENCILIRYCFEEEILYTYGLNNLNKLTHEYNNNNERIIKINDIILIGRRLKENRKKKLIQPFNSDKLVNKCIKNNSKKRKQGKDDVDDTNVITDNNIIPSNNNKLNANKQIIGDNIYILSDLRFISQMDEVKNLFYICKLMCNGGDNTGIKLMKSLDSYGNNWMKSTSALSTTRMDFIRCYLAINAAKISPGDVILDPFVGSGAILDAVTILFGDKCINMSTDIERSCCYSCIKKSNNYSSQVSYGYDSIVNDINYCSFRRESFDAIVCDPPYSFRTSKLNNHSNTDKFISINEIKPINNIDNTTVNNASNDPHLTILNKILLFASRTLRVGKRLVFWWWFPNKDNQYLSDKRNDSIVNDEIYRSLEEICIAVGCFDMKVVNISADDAGLGSNNDVDTEIDTTTTNTSTNCNSKDISKDEGKCNSWNRYLIIFEKISLSNINEDSNIRIENFKPLVNLLINPAYLDIITNKITTPNKISKRTIPLTEFEKELFKSTWTGGKL
jgi:tRNA G10  N-methylase Trm11